MLAAIFICGTTAVMTACKSGKPAGESSNNDELAEVKERMAALYGENKKITGDSYGEDIYLTIGVVEC